MKAAAPTQAGDVLARIWSVLAGVPDPEIPVINIVELGIVREVVAGNPPIVRITPTYSGCPATLVIQTDIRRALDQAGLGAVAMETLLSPPWITDWISAPGREKLRAFGIAPPERAFANRPAPCPRCGSTATEEISAFGSTPCKALWRCRECREPFDRFKCH